MDVVITVAFTIFLSASIVDGGGGGGFSSCDWDRLVFVPFFPLFPATWRMVSGGTAPPSTALTSVSPFTKKGCLSHWIAESHGGHLTGCCIRIFPPCTLLSDRFIPSPTISVVFDLPITVFVGKPTGPDRGWFSAYCTASLSLRQHFGHVG